MQTLSQLTPSSLWQFFAQICAIPHPSHHEEALAQYIINWAKSHHFFVERDKAGNILIRKPATSGLEALTPVVLQAHLDMVPQKNEEVQHNFITDPIQAYIEDGWVKAKGTTLGADNGIGMASALAILVDESVEHGPIEVLLTMTEETGMDGAFALQPNWLQAKILINTDSETEGEIYMGCAGGIDAITCLPLIRQSIDTSYHHYQIQLKGLRGGHSGADIHLGLGNANKLLARFLFEQQQNLALQLIHFNGGTLRNAIPREASATIAIAPAQAQYLEQACQHYQQLLQQELGVIEKNITFQCQVIAPDSEAALTPSCQQRALALLNALPNGVIRMHDDSTHVVETSLNVGVVDSQRECLTVICLIRSLNDSGKAYVASMLHALSELAEAQFSVEGSYPGWKPDPQSPIMQLVNTTYQQLFHQPAQIKVIHAGLECGLFKRPYPELDMVSIGPTIRAPHSPDEKVNIASVTNYWQLLTSVLKAIPVR